MRIISPSCHDCGWDTFPLDKNPYTVQGSRHIMGYGVLLAPAIPIFMSGDEFDAEYKPLPRHTPDLYGKGEPGSGKWLYASWLQWDQLEKAKHRDMLNDVKRILKIRSEHTDLIHAPSPLGAEITIRRVEVKSEIRLPVPYVLSNGKRALLIAGNPTANDVEIQLDLSPEILGFSKTSESLNITELWPLEKNDHMVDMNNLSGLKVTIPADGKAGGGLYVARFDI
jgi:hypothetical protein